MSLIKKARKEIQQIGFNFFENDKNNFVTEFHFIEIIKRDGNSFSIQIEGDGFADGYCPKNYDITNENDLKTSLQAIKKKLHYAVLNEDFGFAKKGDMGRISIYKYQLRLNFFNKHISVSESQITRI
jgi:hypothetical protein